jgi:hypothetical protein
MGFSPVIEVEKWREAVNQASPAFVISQRTAVRKRSSADGTGEVSVVRVAELHLSLIGLGIIRY